MCTANRALKIKIFFSIKQNENIWQILILLQGIPFTLVSQTKDIHINTDMVEQQHIWK